MADDTHDVGLCAVLIEGVAQGLAVDGQARIVRTVGVVPARERLIQCHRIDADEGIANDVFAGYQV